MAKALRARSGAFSMQRRPHHALDLEILTQPDDASCGPTCLHAVYRYFGEDVSLDEVIRDVPTLPAGGTLAVNLANHALKRGYEALIYTYNLTVFADQFEGARSISDRLRAQARERGPKAGGRAPTSVLELGGSSDGGPDAGLLGAGSPRSARS
jgi:hypothetical protein